MKLRYHQLAKELGVEPEALTAAAAKEFALEKEPVAIASVPEVVEAWLRETFTAKEGQALPEGEERVPVPGVIGEVNELTSEAPPELDADAEAFAEKAAEEALASVALEPALETTPEQDVFPVVRFDGVREPDLHLEPGLAARVRELLAGRTIESYLLDLDRGLFVFVTQGQKYRVPVDE